MHNGGPIPHDPNRDDTALLVAFDNSYVIPRAECERLNVYSMRLEGMTAKEYAAWMSWAVCRHVAWPPTQGE